MTYRVEYSSPEHGQMSFDMEDMQHAVNFWTAISRQHLNPTLEAHDGLGWYYTIADWHAGEPVLQAHNANDAETKAVIEAILELQK